MEGFNCQSFINFTVPSIMHTKKPKISAVHNTQDIKVDVLKQKNIIDTVLPSDNLSCSFQEEIKNSHYPKYVTCSNVQYLAIFITPNPHKKPQLLPHGKFQIFPSGHYEHYTNA